MFIGKLFNALKSKWSMIYTDNNNINLQGDTPVNVHLEGGNLTISFVNTEQTVDFIFDVTHWLEDNGYLQGMTKVDCVGSLMVYTYQVGAVMNPIKELCDAYKQTFVTSYYITSEDNYACRFIESSVDVEWLEKKNCVQISFPIGTRDLPLMIAEWLFKHGYIASIGDAKVTMLDKETIVLWEYNIVKNIKSEPLDMGLYDELL